MIVPLVVNHRNRIIVPDWMKLDVAARSWVSASLFRALR